MDSALPGLRMYGEFVEGEEADGLMERCMEEIPWHVPKWSSGFDGFRGEGKDAVELPQLAYNYEERVRDAEPNDVLEVMIEKVEAFLGEGASVSDVWCNRFNTGEMHIEWHQDQYEIPGIFVLSFGSMRRVEFRKKTGMFSKAPPPHITLTPGHGDAYFFSMEMDKHHKHRVPAMPDVDDVRLSFVFFVSGPQSLPPEHPFPTPTS